MTTVGPTTGVLLMSFGSAATAEEVPGYLARVRGGREAPDELVREFQRRYALIGGSPLNRITADQALALESLLNARPSAQNRFRVAIGMRFARPSIAEGLERLAETGTKRIVTIIMSPQYSPIFMGGYGKAVEEAIPALPADIHVSVAQAWHDEPRFIDALAERVRTALDQIPAEERKTIPIMMTVHSLPQNMVVQESAYLEQLRQTAEAVASRAGLEPAQWRQAYQSAGHSQEEWLKPDFKDLLPGLRAEGHRNVLVVPIQFLADHLETLYDVDTAGRAEANEAGIGFVRAQAPNTMPQYIEALAAVVDRELAIRARRP